MTKQQHLSARARKARLTTAQRVIRDNAYGTHPSYVTHAGFDRMRLRQEAYVSQSIELHDLSKTQQKAVGLISKKPIGPQNPWWPR